MVSQGRKNLIRLDEKKEYSTSKKNNGISNNENNVNIIATIISIAILIKM